MTVELYANAPRTRLSAAITSSATTLTVDSSTGFPAAATGVSQFRIVIDSEILLVTNVSGTTWTVTRAAEGTTAAAHNKYAAVVHPVPTAGSLTDGLALASRDLAGGRLTLTSGTYVTTADVTGAGTIRYTPGQTNGVGHNQIALYDGSKWKLYTFAELSLALTITSGKNYDVFVYDNAGTLTLELSAAWASDSARTDALAVQDGVIVKSAATTRRYLGTIRASGSNTTEDSAAKRFVWNAYNRAVRSLIRQEATASWTYSGALRQANANAANKVEAVFGLSTDSVLVFSSELVAWVANATVSVGIGYDSTAAYYTGTASSGLTNLLGASQAFTLIGFFQGVPSIGYHFWSWLEASTANTTFSGSGGYGLVGSILA